MEGKTNPVFEEENAVIMKIEPSDIIVDKLNGHSLDGPITAEKESSYLAGQYRRHARLIKNLAYACLHLAVFAYFGYATYYFTTNEQTCSLDPAKECGFRFCTGYGMLILLVCFTYYGLFYYYVFKPYVGKKLYKKFIQPAFSYLGGVLSNRFARIIVYVAILALVAIFLFLENRQDPGRLKALIAPCFFVAMGVVFSKHRSSIQWGPVFSGIFCQFLLGVFCIRSEVGRSIFKCIGDKVATFLSFSESGSRFVFGMRIIDDQVFAFAILPVIFFFSFIISMLYYLGTMQWVVMKMGWLLQSLLGTTVCESVISAANIFLSMTESPLLIRPYIKSLTASELHAIMVSGFATVSGSVLAAYMSFGASPAHLITSSVMAAPATLAMSKLYYPETEESQTKSDNMKLEKSQDSSILDAASNGATVAIPVILGTIANIVAFVAFIAFLNAVVNWFGVLVGLDEIDFEWIFSKLFIPLAWSMGVPWEDCPIIAKVIATKSIINEFVAYERLGEYIANGDISVRSHGIGTFAICGFANPSSMGILMGSLSVMAPEKRSTITAVALRAFVVGSIVCFVSASFASLLMQDDLEADSFKKILIELRQSHNITTN